MAKGWDMSDTDLHNDELDEDGPELEQPLKGTWLSAINGSPG
jgi:hypothetical protein